MAGDHYIMQSFVILYLDDTRPEFRHSVVKVIVLSLNPFPSFTLIWMAVVLIIK